MGFLNEFRTRSITVLAIQAGGCRGCALEFSMAMSKESRVKGVTLTGNPKHADALLITGCINKKSKQAIKTLYDQIPAPKAVIAVGACSCSGSLFRAEENGLYPAEDILPVDAWIRGCTPDMSEMMETVLRAVECSHDKEESRRGADE